MCNYKTCVFNRENEGLRLLPPGIVSPPNLLVAQDLTEKSVKHLRVMTFGGIDY